MIKKNAVKSICEWVLALVIACAFVNCILFFVYHPAPWLDMDKNATHGLFYPGSKIVYGEEGYGIRNVDKNGFVNPDRRLDNSDYILFMGSSHSVAKEIKEGKSFIDLIEQDGQYVKHNQQDQWDLNRRNVYSIAMDGHYYPDIVSGFGAAVKQFNKAQAVVIEIYSLDYTKDELKNSLTKREYDESRTGDGVVNSLSFKNKIKVAYQNYLPILRAISKNMKAEGVENVSSGKKSGVSDEYKALLNDTLKSLRNEYKGDIYIAYHPLTKLSADGQLEIIDSNAKEVFSELCAENDIYFLDAGDRFIAEYEKNRKLPYGFSNTAYGTGHLNETGHKIMSEMILEKMGEVEK